MWGWLRRRSRAIPDALWQRTLDRYPFLAKLTKAERAHLRRLCGRFLARKEFTGTERLHISDEIALAIAAQACLPVLHLDQHGKALAWYSDFVGIVVHRREVIAQRETMDHAGVVHRYREVLAGEAMHKGPVMLNWRDVAQAGASAGHGYNVVIHEFVHKMDMQSGRADGCPPLPPGFLGARGPAAARRLWLATLQPAYDAFREQVILAERFSGEPPWLNAYGATSLAEFFAVTCEAYFVNRARFELELPALMPLYDEFFNRMGALPP